MNRGFMVMTLNCGFMVMILNRGSMVLTLNRGLMVMIPNRGYMVMTLNREFMVMTLKLRPKLRNGRIQRFPDPSNCKTMLTIFIDYSEVFQHEHPPSDKIMNKEY